MRKTLLFFIAIVCTTTLWATRKEIQLNNNWLFRYSWQVQKNSEERVDLPHTWNAQDALSGKQDYFRGMGNYRKSLPVSEDLKGKRIYLKFEGANTVTNLFINQKHVGEHRGGYGAFVFDITDFVDYGKDNEVLVRVNNSLQLDIMPLLGDFNFYGGIYRDVYLVITEPEHISLTDYASPGVYLIQDNVTDKKAEVTTKVMLSNYDSNKKATLTLNVTDGNKNIISKTEEIDLPKGENNSHNISFTIDNPRLWNGKKDPFMYSAEVTLSVDGVVKDKVTQPLGLRYYHTDASEGFFLNGEHIKLRGICRHQDRAEVGNALRPEHHDEDMQIILDMGSNAMRLAHYPQASYFYDLADKNGLIVWAEIPFIGPGGYAERGYVNQQSFRDNGKEQLKELIRQHYNHPSICMWGLYNELKTEGDSPEEYIAELNALAHQEDPTRPTVAASFLGDDNPLNQHSDMIAWNKYYGWYGGSFDHMGTWADGFHKKFPEYKLGISEYGAGASIYHQQEELKATVATGWWHPENWQTAYHVGNWKAINERPFIWGSFIWNLFDFGAAHRTEGDRPGINDKGLVTFDRKVKKDSYYFYKANWNKEEPMVYISERRNTLRGNEVTSITVFTNFADAELWVNGKNLGKQSADNYATITWENVKLQSGSNTVEVKAGNKKNVITDKVVWTYNENSTTK